MTIRSMLNQPLINILLGGITLPLALLIYPLKINAMPLTQAEVEQKIQTIPQWQQEQQTITRTFEFKNFVEAIAFVNRLVDPAEAAGHHPDLAISYNKVTVSLTTHDAGGLTQMDFDLAQKISEISQ